MAGCLIPHTPIAVDYWKRWDVRSKICFLSHMHTDHTQGLTSSWNQPIFCSEITRSLAIEQLKIQPSLLVTIPVGESTIIPLDNEGVEKMTVTLIDANHCPGAVMFLFQGYFGCILHTGDFRYFDGILDIPPFTNDIVINTLYLDNTYCDPKCEFPTKTEAKENILEIIRNNSDKDIRLGMDMLGKEDLLCEIAKDQNVPIFVDEFRYKTTKLLGCSEYFTLNVEETYIRAERKSTVNKSSLAHLNKFVPTIGVIPSALYQGGNNPFAESETVFVVPYSDHSSFSELKKFVAKLKPQRIIPIVGKRNKNIDCHDRTDMSVFTAGMASDAGHHVFDVPPTVQTFISRNFKANVNCPGKKRKASASFFNSRPKRACGIVFSPKKQGEVCTDEHPTSELLEENDMVIDTNETSLDTGAKVNEELPADAANKTNQETMVLPIEAVEKNNELYETQQSCQNLSHVVDATLPGAAQGSLDENPNTGHSMGRQEKIPLITDITNTEVSNNPIQRCVDELIAAVDTTLSDVEQGSSEATSKKDEAFAVVQPTLPGRASNLDERYPDSEERAAVPIEQTSSKIKEDNPWIKRVNDGVVEDIETTFSGAPQSSSEETSQQGNSNSGEERQAPLSEQIRTQNQSNDLAQRSLEKPIAVTRTTVPFIAQGSSEKKTWENRSKSIQDSTAPLIEPERKMVKHSNQDEEIQKSIAEAEKTLPGVTQSISERETWESESESIQDNTAPLIEQERNMGTHSNQDEDIQKSFRKSIAEVENTLPGINQSISEKENWESESKSIQDSTAPLIEQERNMVTHSDWDEQIQKSFGKLTAKTEETLSPGVTRSSSEMTSADDCTKGSNGGAPRLSELARAKVNDQDGEAHQYLKKSVHVVATTSSGSVESRSEQTSQGLVGRALLTIFSSLWPTKENSPDVRADESVPSATSDEQVVEGGHAASITSNELQKTPNSVTLIDSTSSNGNQKSGDENIPSPINVLPQDSQVLQSSKEKSLPVPPTMQGNNESPGSASNLTVSKGDDSERQTSSQKSVAGIETVGTTTLTDPVEVESILEAVSQEDKNLSFDPLESVTRAGMTLKEGREWEPTSLQGPTENQKTPIIAPRPGLSSKALPQEAECENSSDFHNKGTEENSNQGKSNYVTSTQEVSQTQKEKEVCPNISNDTQSRRRTEVDQNDLVCIHSLPDAQKLSKSQIVESARKEKRANDQEAFTTSERADETGDYEQQSNPLSVRNVTNSTQKLASKYKLYKCDLRIELNNPAHSRRMNTKYANKNEGDVVSVDTLFPTTQQKSSESEIGSCDGRGKSPEQEKRSEIIGNNGAVVYPRRMENMEITINENADGVGAAERKMHEPRDKRKKTQSETQRFDCNLLEKYQNERKRAKRRVSKNLVIAQNEVPSTTWRTPVDENADDLQAICCSPSPPELPRAAKHRSMKRRPASKTNRRTPQGIYTGDVSFARAVLERWIRENVKDESA